MRGRGSLHTRALLIWVGMPCAVLVALGNYSVAQAQRPGDADDQTALAAPRIGLRGAPGIGLPQPLSPSEAARTRRIFSLQDSGAIADLARETDRLENPLLLGTILAVVVWALLTAAFFRTNWAKGAIIGLVAWVLSYLVALLLAHLK